MEDAVLREGLLQLVLKTNRDWWLNTNSPFLFNKIKTSCGPHHINKQLSKFKSCKKCVKILEALDHRRSWSCEDKWTSETISTTSFVDDIRCIVVGQCAKCSCLARELRPRVPCLDWITIAWSGLFEGYNGKDMTSCWWCCYCRCRHHHRWLCNCCRRCCCFCL